MDPEFVLKGVLPPVLLALLLVSVAGVRLLPLAVGAGLIIAYARLKAPLGKMFLWPALPHELWTAPNGTEWLLWIVAAAAVVALCDHRGWLRGAGSAVGMCVAAAGTWLVLRAVAAEWDTTKLVLTVGSAATIVALLVLGHRNVLANAPASPFPAILFTVVLSLDAALLTLGKSSLLGQLCGACAAALGAAAGTALWRRPFALRAADAAWLGTVHGLFLIAGVHLAWLTWPAAACALVAPVAPLVLRKTTTGRTWMLAATGLVMAPMAAAVWLAVAAYDSGGY